jgi:hypothetical protein
MFQEFRVLAGGLFSRLLRIGSSERFRQIPQLIRQLWMGKPDRLLWKELTLRRLRRP